jgi:hypothetical protein
MKTTPIGHSTKSREMLFVLTAQGHRHVWAPCDVTQADREFDPDVTEEENAAVHCLKIWGMACAPYPVRDQHNKLVTRSVSK